MRRTKLLAVALLLTPVAASAQTVTWNDRAPDTDWFRDAPEVHLRMSTQGVNYGGAIQVQFEVSDNAYVVVARVANDGKLTILFPYSRNQRAFVHAGRINTVANPRLAGGAAFAATDRFSGYVFAIASYAPLDLSAFESRDFERFGAFSRFTLANRSIALRPDLYIEQFATQVLWDQDTPFDLDVAHYFSLTPSSISSSFQALARCAAQLRALNSHGILVSGRVDLDDWDLVPTPYRSMCRDYYSGLRCVWSAAVYSTWGCVTPNDPNAWSIVLEPRTASDPSNAATPNEAVMRGGLFAPTPVPVSATDPLTAEAIVRLDQLRSPTGNWDELRSIPQRVTRRLKEQDEDPTAATPTRFGPVAPDVGMGRNGGKVVAAEPERAVDRPSAPTRESTKPKTTEPRRRIGDQMNTGTSRPRAPEPRPTMTKRPEPRPAARPATIQGTGTERVKPPRTETKPPAEETKPPH